MSLIGILLQPLSIAVIAITLIGIGAIAYVIRKDGGGISIGKESKKHVDILRPIDHSGFTLPIINEMEKQLEGPKKGGIYWRFYKGGPGWNFPMGVRKFFAIEGDAWTGIIINDQQVKVKLSEALRILWGEDTYDKMPKLQKDIVEKHQFGVTIDPEPVPKKDKELIVTAEDHDRENIKVGMEELRKNMKQGKKMDIQTFLFGGAAFSALLLILIIMTGHLKM